jgi:hypothetical protein
MDRAFDDYFEGLLAIATSEESFEYTPLMMAFERVEDFILLNGGEEKASVVRRRVACIPAVANYNDLAS